MPLINSLGETNFRSLKYSGTQPLIRKDLNNPPTYNSLLKQFESAGDDAARLTLLMATGQGTKFLANTALLNSGAANVVNKQLTQRTTSPNNSVVGGKPSLGQVLSAVGKAVGGILQSVARTAIKTSAVTASTLAQAGVSGTGQHFVYGFAGGQGYLQGVRGHQLSKNGSEINIPFGFLSNLENAQSTLLSKDTALGIGSRNAPKVSADQYITYEGRNAGRILKDPTKLGPESVPTTIENSIKKDTRIGLGENRRIGRYVDYNAAPSGDSTNNDRVNMSSIKVTKDYIPEAEEDRDFIKFKVEVINPDDQNMNAHMHFRAYLDSFSDGFKGDWANHSYVGRADNFYTYKGFDRDISFAFKSFASSREELKPLYTKLNVLSSTTAPTYNPDNYYMRGTLVRLTVGDYIVNQPGYFSSIDLAWSNNYPWEIKLRGDAEGPTVQSLPHLLDVNCAFKPIHTFVPQYGGERYFTNPEKNQFFNPNSVARGEEAPTTVSALSPIGSTLGAFSGLQESAANVGNSLRNLFNGNG